MNQLGGRRVKVSIELDYSGLDSAVIKNNVYGQIIKIYKKNSLLLRLDERYKLKEKAYLFFVVTPRYREDICKIGKAWVFSQNYHISKIKDVYMFLFAFFGGAFLKCSRKMVVNISVMEDQDGSPLYIAIGNIELLGD